MICSIKWDKLFWACFMCVLWNNFVASQEVIEQFVSAGDTVEISCSSDTVFVFDSIEYGDCAIQTYRTISSSCLGKTSCTLDTTAYPCGSTNLIAKYRCVDSSLIIDICEANGQTYNKPLLYIISPDYLTPEYPANQDCSVNLNEGEMSSVYVLDINIQPRDDPSDGCYDWLRVYIDGIMEDGICGDDIMSLKGSTNINMWENESDMSVMFKSDAISSNQYLGFILRVEGPEQPEETTTESSTSTSTTSTTVTTTTETTTETSSSTSTDSTTQISSSTSTTSSSTPTDSTTPISSSTSSTSSSTSTDSTTPISSSTSTSATTKTSKPGPYDDCASRPCQNGGICYDDLHTYVCKCPAKYYGKSCEYTISSASTTQAAAAVSVWITLIMSMILYY